MSKLLVAGLNVFQEFGTSMIDGSGSRFKQIDNDVRNILSTSIAAHVVLTASDLLRVSGYRNWSCQLSPGVALHSCIADHTGFQAALDSDGQLYVARDQSLHRLDCRENRKLSLLAMAGNGNVAFVQLPSDKDPDIKLGSTRGMSALFEWHSDSADICSSDVVWHRLPGRAKQLAAGLGSFALLTEDGSVFTWGDPRHRTLARAANDLSSSVPGLVQELTGLKIDHIALGGWMGGAVSSDGALYLWGSSMPGRDSIACLKTLSREEMVALVSLSEDADDEPDVIDLSIGRGHAILHTADGCAYGVGENNHGQLGLSEPSFLQEWTKLELSDKVKDIACGFRTTLLLTD